jgi:hypothetical protein
VGVSVGRLGEKIEGLEFSSWEWLPALKDEISRFTKNWEACLRDLGALSSFLSNKTKLALIGARTREESRFYQSALAGDGRVEGLALKDEISRLARNWGACLRDPGALSSFLSNGTKLAPIGARTREKSSFYRRDLTGGGRLREAPFHPPLM